MLKGIAPWNRTARLAVSAVFAVATAWGLAGCLASGGSSTRLSGEYVGVETFSQIEVGKTDTRWLLAVLGEPTSRADLDEGKEVWKWGWSRQKVSSGALLFIFSSKTRREDIGAVFVEIEDDVVVRKWRD